MTLPREPQTPLEKLLHIVAVLRGEGGCPWDREQTLDSLKPFLVEETYEVLDAMDSGSLDQHKEELGDLLLQIVLQAQIRHEQGDFTFDDIAEAISEKLVRRHPHVFSDVQVEGTHEVLRNWEAIKSREKSDAPRPLLEGVPSALPALQKAQRVQSRVARVGFDWPDLEGVVAKIEEELGELKDAIRDEEPSRVREELGDLLFSVVNLARFQHMEAEEALRETITKFAGRFHDLERRIRAQGREVRDCSLAELDAVWEEIKTQARAVESGADAPGCGS